MKVHVEETHISSEDDDNVIITEEHKYPFNFPFWNNNHKKLMEIKT